MARPQGCSTEPDTTFNSLKPVAMDSSVSIHRQTRFETVIFSHVAMMIEMHADCDIIQYTLQPIANNSYSLCVSFTSSTNHKNLWITLRMPDAAAYVPAGSVRGRTWLKLIERHILYLKTWIQRGLWWRIREVDVVDMSITSRQCQIKGSNRSTSHAICESLFSHENEIAFMLFLEIGDPSLSSGFVTTWKT